jgi:DNA repair protein RadC
MEAAAFIGHPHHHFGPAGTLALAKESTSKPEDMPRLRGDNMEQSGMGSSDQLVRTVTSEGLSTSRDLDGLRTGQQHGNGYATMIRDLPRGERPRERLRELGPDYLSNPELIAILLGTGIKGESVLSLSTRLLASRGGLAGMSRASYGELCTVNGISDAKACQIMAAFTLGRRMVSMHHEDRASIGSPQDVFNLLGAEMGLLDQERLRVLLLNTKNEVLAAPEVYKGNVSSSMVRVSELLRPAVRENCPALIMVHNHPSGDPTPSPEDILVTRKVRTSAEMMDIELLDHIVIGSRGYVSLKDRKLGFG